MRIEQIGAQHQTLKTRISQRFNRRAHRCQHVSGNGSRVAGRHEFPGQAVFANRTGRDHNVSATDALLHTPCRANTDDSACSRFAELFEADSRTGRTYTMGNHTDFLTIKYALGAAVLPVSADFCDISQAVQHRIDPVRIADHQQALRDGTRGCFQKG